MSIALTLLLSLAAHAMPNFTAASPSRMTQYQAEAYCQDQGARLASTRDFALFSQAHGALGLVEVEDAVLPMPAGYYKVESQNQKPFYFNHQGYVAPAGDLGSKTFWTSSIVLGHPTHAHVFYGAWGGGGGTPEEHARSFPHFAACVVD
jgi:hypothetical protein